MPVTPLHAGIPGLVSYCFPRRVDIMGAVIGSVIIDIDFFLFLATGSPLHGFFHTFFGATILAVVIIIVLRLLYKPIIALKRWLKWEPESSLLSLSLGAFLGTWSHIILDSLIYSDLDLYYPRTGNPHYRVEGHDTIFTTVYLVAALTTLALMMLYTWHYFSALEAEKKASHD